jgi:LacI family transcriptional regulator
VINNRTRVGAQVRAPVLRAVQEFHKTPDPAAKSMRSRSSMSVGCIVREIVIPPLAEFVRAAQSVLEEAGYALLLSNSAGRIGSELELLQRMRSRRVDGIMIGSYADMNGEVGERLRGLGIPIVMVDRDEPAWADAVMTDHADGMELAVMHLIGLGHRRIALLTGQPELLPARDRVRGYLEAFRKAGLTPDPRLIRTGSFLAADGYRSTSLLLAGKGRPTAVIAGGIAMLPGVIRAVRAHGLRIPVDVSVIGTGQSELAEFHTPPISIQHWDHGETGRVAASLLLDRILKKAGPEPRRVVLPNRFTPHGSCGPAPADA